MYLVTIKGLIYSDWHAVTNYLLFDQIICFPLARLIIAVHKWGMIIVDNDGKSSSKRSATTDEYSLVFWREGVLALYYDGYFLVESFEDDVSSALFNIIH